MGLLFMPDKEYLVIVKWLQDKSPNELEEFKARCKKYDGFYLYDQQQACQFLDNKNLCRLHEDKVKPTECYWWPLHVYIGDDNCLDIRVSTSCCDGYKFIDNKSSVIEDIKMVVEKLGQEIFRKFRSKYQGSYNNRSILKIPDNEIPNV